MIKRNLKLGYLLIAIGITGVILSVFADSIGVGSSGFGFRQSSGLVIGIFLCAAGLVKINITNTKISAQILSVIYVGCLLYICLKPLDCGHIHEKILMDAKDFGWQDFALNTAVFIPLGYLLMSGFANRSKYIKAFLFKNAIFIIIIGAVISLFIELTQYYFILNRKSSTFDLIANTFGTCVGIGVYLLMKQNSEFRR